LDNTKYGKYIVREPFGKARSPRIETPVIRIGQDSPIAGWGGAPFAMTMEAIYQPLVLEESKHTHEEDQILCFMGANPKDFHDFGAEATIELGDENEKHVINSTLFIYIPKGLKHCPLIFTRVDRPIVFADIVLAPLYVKHKT
jgi:hypothetical protein